MPKLLDDALARFSEIVERNDQKEIMMLALRLAPPTMRMLRRDQQIAKTTDAEKFDKAFEGAGDADICRAILAERVESPEPSDAGGDS